MKDTSWAADWRNGEIWDLFPAIVEKWSKLPNLHLTPLHTRSLTMSRHNFHMHTDAPDCTHYCYTPYFYQPLYHEMLVAALKLK